jgi:iron complex outermembrane recepter protein
MKLKITNTLLSLFIPTLFFAQTEADTIQVKNIEQAVEITATRLTITDIKAPLAVSVLDKKRLQTGTQQLSPYEVLSAVPGVFAMNPDNFSQDLRISIRGFGARSAFGIRGIRLFTDGLPEGTPDGQADVDNLDMGVVRQMEVLRGAASGLYGNAAGGVISMQTEMPTSDKPQVEIQLSRGQYGFQRYQAKMGQNVGKFFYFANTSLNKSEGYRQNAQMQNAIFNLKTGYRFNENTKLTLLANYGNSPTANDAGGLTAKQATDSATIANPNNLLFQVGEKVKQGRVGMTFETKFAKNHGFSVRSFYTSRTLINRLGVLANGFGELNRNYYGGGFAYQFDAKWGSVIYRLKTGLDIEKQNDNRSRFSYLKITEGGLTRYDKNKLVLDQLETFQSTGIYLLQDIQPTEKLLISLGLRHDKLQLQAADKYLTDGDQSGKLNFNKINPSLGINYSISEHAAIYANYAQTFESPTLNELSNNPALTGGFNPDLKPQQAKTYEIGSKGSLFSKLKYDVAVYKIETENDVVPYQITGQTGKTFFRNAGKTDRKGIELGLTYVFHPNFTAHFVQTFSDFEYKTYTVNTTNFDGKILPGIPKNQGQLELRYLNPKGFFGIFQLRNVQKVYANDGNTAFSDSYNTVNLRVGNTFTKAIWQFEPYAGVNNLFNAKYVANVQINATADRFFEPAMGTYIFGGVKIRLH